MNTAMDVKQELIPVSKVFSTLQNEFSPLKVPPDLDLLTQHSSLVSYGGMMYTYIVSEALASAVCEVAKRKNGSLIHPAFGYELEKGLLSKGGGVSQRIIVEELLQKPLNVSQISRSLQS
ncbi:hypothetical protein JH06_0031 [Blastocystis sp. subtype 4]|uniref:hypothetical protein n=1 Tax=Blastocystis sp. subtype 4 TaxID=944170 RepID=UPI0007121C3C|nr:hypothetical protein JH06_0031 [Blastocystis sp. subtype 4]KNB46832.1 hypothetical protein JH06_0031 [Blastocystis sp. subtype 4]|eukprot:XP_014530275.1 hypothetical protein JH06_0031 [Blastocystis sp. subtype 4]